MKHILFILFLVFSLSPVCYAAETAAIKILIVPGHDDAVWGAQYGRLKEADMNLKLGTQLFNILKNDKRFEVHITRNDEGYTKEFSDYFASQQDNILAFRRDAKESYQKKVDAGTFVVKDDTIDHNAAPESVAQILYGVNKWADDNKMDAVIHIHFNDHPRKSVWDKGAYKGFAIYVPEDAMANSQESTDLGEKILTQLATRYDPSNYPPEKGGLIPDQSLIALGEHSTLVPSVHSVLVEYGYIYQFGRPSIRNKVYKTMANLTAAGIQNYFFTSLPTSKNF